MVNAKIRRFYSLTLGITFGLLFGMASLAQGIDPNTPSNSPASSLVPSQEKPTHITPVKANLISEDTSIQPGHPFWVAIEMDMEKSWHAYWKNPGDAGMAPIISWSLPEGFTAGEVQWATPKRFTVDNTVGFGYEDQLVLLVEITPPHSLADTHAKLAANVRWVVCSDNTCLPGSSPITLDIPVATKAPEKDSSHIDLFSTARAKAPKNHQTLAARHDDALIELSFQENGHAIKDAEFFPEEEGVISYTATPLFEASREAPGKYTLVFEELTPQTSLKGILVVHTENGTSQAYHVNVPVSSADRNAPIASLDKKGTASVGSPSHTPHGDAFEFQGGVGLAIALAFLGGLILNLMPCVLPVISFKILSFISLAGKQRALIFKHGLAFSTGVLLSFWVMAALLLALQAYGRSVGWGFQLQEPLFVGILAAFIFIFGLSLFGVFELGTSVMAKAGEVQHKSGQKNALIGSFMSGILATAVATPCTGPFLGTTVGFAVTLPPLEAMMIFTSLGLGMSSPYLALAAFPSLLKVLPKPGNWMITFKELMGFLMMASVIWLTWVFSAQTGSFSTSIFLASLFFFALACWVYGRWATPLCSRLTRSIGMAMALIFFAVGSYTIVTSTSEWAQAMGGVTTASQFVESEVADVWEEFSPERVAELRAQGIPVFIDFTAKWCLICQANHAVLSSSDVADMFSQKGVVRMKADWTKSDEVIAAELKKFGRNSVPLYVFYHGNEGTEPHILPQLLTPEIVIETLGKVKASL